MKLKARPRWRRGPVAPSLLLVPFRSRIMWATVGLLFPMTFFLPVSLDVGWGGGTAPLYSMYRVLGWRLAVVHLLLLALIVLALYILGLLWLALREAIASRPHHARNSP